jgi:class 3 adenylate cyclase
LAPDLSEHDLITLSGIPQTPRGVSLEALQHSRNWSSTDGGEAIPLAESVTWRPAGMCSMFVCDIVAFGDTERDDEARAHVRASLYGGLERSFAAGEISLGECHHEDRGDGVMIVVPPHFDTARLITSVLEELRAEIRRHNKLSSDTAQLRLRVAVHTGECRWDGNGVVGEALNHAFRILDAPAFKAALRASDADVALIVSQHVYDEIVRHGRGRVDPGAYRQVDVSVKETRTTAWIMMPGGLAAVPPAAVVPSEPAVYRGGEIPGIDLVDLLLRIPRMAEQSGRDRVVGALPIHIGGVIARAADARSDVYEIIRTCRDYDDGLPLLFQTIRAFVGDSTTLREAEDAVRRQLLEPERRDGFH